MARLSEYDYIFAFGLIFAFLDAWNIGANDVANSFATSVSSRSLTMKQAMILASICEFAGAVGVGARVADTIRSKIISPQLFAEDPAVLMLGMTTALVASSLYLTFATKLGMPVSTTHSITGGVLGMAIAAVGSNGVNWGWTGVSQVFAAWAIAPGLAGCFGAIIFLVTKYAVMRRKNPVRAAFIMVPIYIAITTGILTMLIVWKGAASASSTVAKWGAGEYVGVILGTAFGCALVAIIFLLPYLYRKLILDDWQIRWWHIPLGPLVLRRGEVPPNEEGRVVVRNYYHGHKTREELEAEGHDDIRVPADVETQMQDDKEGTAAKTSETNSSGEAPTSPLQTTSKYSASNLFYISKRAFFHGVDVDVVAEQKKKSILTGNLEEMHARATHYDNKAEHMYSFLQVLTACTSSFVHGANDIANACGPLASIYLIWSTAELSTKSPVPIWVLCYCAASLCIGLWTYGYNIMRNLGNRLTLHSPSRGFSMELGSAITVTMATRLALPVSTTQCITGATVGVGLTTGDWRAINWRMVAWIYGGWIITLPVTGLISGCLMGIIINAPRFGLVE
ncbi:phosphate-repressible phosphate permease-like protein [Xylogone sp. PMI_703]|nr:phosphate-repressible phosphate permease-like protein [Xylogone sp. PMI_703]